MDFTDVAVHTNARVYRHRTAGPRFQHYHQPRHHRAANTEVSYKHALCFHMYMKTLFHRYCVSVERSRKYRYSHRIGQLQQKQNMSFSRYSGLCYYQHKTYFYEQAQLTDAQNSQHWYVLITECFHLPYYGWPTFPSVLWCFWLGLLTCKTVSRITYTVLVEMLNPAQSNFTKCWVYVQCIQLSLL